MELPPRGIKDAESVGLGVGPERAFVPEAEREELDLCRKQTFKDTFNLSVPERIPR